MREDDENNLQFRNHQVKVYHNSMGRDEQELVRLFLPFFDLSVPTVTYKKDDSYKGIKVNTTITMIMCLLFKIFEFAYLEY